MVFTPTEFLCEYRPSRKHSVFSTHGWWLNRWPFLGWLETFVKIAAWFFVPLAVQSSPTASSSVSQPFAVETALMLLAAFLLAGAVIDRLVYREIISMIFVFPNNWAHWKIALAMYKHGRAGITTRYFRIFCWLMFAGDIVKLLFFAVHDFSRLDVKRYILYALVAFFAGIYLLVLLLDYGYLPTFSMWAYKSLPVALIAKYLG